MLDYKDGYLRTGFQKIYDFENQQPLNNQTHIHRINGTQSLNLSQFNEYDFEIFTGMYKVRINGRVYFEKQFRPGLDYYGTRPWVPYEHAQYFLISTVMADLDKVEENLSHQDDYFSLLIDYIRVYRNFSLENFTRISTITPEEFCELPEKINAYDKFELKPSLNLI